MAKRHYKMVRRYSRTDAAQLKAAVDGLRLYKSPATAIGLYP